MSHFEKGRPYPNFRWHVFVMAIVPKFALKLMIV